MTRRACILLGVGVATQAQQPAADFVCPMDPDIHRPGPGRCPRCGMALVARLPSFAPYTVRISTDPSIPKAGQPLQLRFEIRGPAQKALSRTLQEVHERLFHLFVISEDLTFFAHEHPVLQDDGTFILLTVLPRGGLYRILCDFYPRDAQPQLITQTLLVRGGTFAAPQWEPSSETQNGLNVNGTLRLEPAQAIAGKETLVFLHLSSAEKLEPYLGAWAHLLAASGDLIDLIHTHPTIADGGPDLQFNLIFPRKGNYKLWIQLQRNSVVNTLAFTVPVGSL